MGLIRSNCFFFFGRTPKHEKSVNMNQNDHQKTHESQSVVTLFGSFHAGFANVIEKRNLAFNYPIGLVRSKNILLTKTCNEFQKA